MAYQYGAEFLNIEWTKYLGYRKSAWEFFSEISNS